MKCVAQFALPVLVLVGCSNSTDGLPREAVTGTVTLDGRPLKQGSIQFVPGSERESTSGGAVITEGRFAIARPQGLTPGSYRVVINSGEGAPVPPDQPPGATPPGGKELIPARYNEKTTLTADVKAGGSNAFAFDLATKE
jgi:hypothetical protein